MIVNRIKDLNKKKFEELLAEYGDNLDSIQDEDELLTEDQKAYYLKNCAGEEPGEKMDSFYMVPLELGADIYSYCFS